jgi:hypothetical protein
MHVPSRNRPNQAVSGHHEGALKAHPCAPCRADAWLEPSNAGRALERTIATPAGPLRSPDGGGNNRSVLSIVRSLNQCRLYDGREELDRKHERQGELSSGALRAEGQKLAAAVTPVSPPLGDCGELVDVAASLQRIDGCSGIKLGSARDLAARRPTPPSKQSPSHDVRERR